MAEKEEQNDGNEQPHRAPLFGHPATMANGLDAGGRMDEGEDADVEHGDEDQRDLLKHKSDQKQQLIELTK